MAGGIPETLDGLRVPVEGLRPYPGNPRRGDVELLKRSLMAHGQYRPVVVNRRTMEVLAGNHTLAAVVELGWPEVAATFVDVDEERAARIALVDNRAAEVGGYDDRALAQLLGSLPDLDATGWQPADLDALLEGLAPAVPPDGFADPEDGMTTAYQCPQCGYEWSGLAAPSQNGHGE